MRNIKSHLIVFSFLVLIVSGCASAQIGHNKNPTLQAKTGLPSRLPPAYNQQPKRPEAILCTIPAKGNIISQYGYRKLYTKKPRLHKGIDFGAKRGSEVMASGSGKVIHAGSMGAYGRTVDIDHGGGLTTRYAHLGTISVKPGEQIQAGEKLGTVGSSGRTTGANLHFEVRLNNQHQDPLLLVGWTDTQMQAHLNSEQHDSMPPIHD